MFENGFGLSFRNYRRQGRNVRLFYRLQAAEMFQQTPSRGFSHSSDFS
jgi:hypothetical protein